jgi:hypothetical protein
MRSGLIDLGKALDELADTDVVGLPDQDVREALPALLTAFNQISALVATVVASFDTRDLSQADACKTTTAWLVAFGRMTGGNAASVLTRGRLLRELPALHAAATHGHASTEHVNRVVELTHRVDLPTVKQFDTILADLAAAARPADLATACQRIAAHNDPDGKPPDPERDFNRRELHLTRRGNMYAVRGRLDLEGGATLATAFDALLKPPAPTDDRSAPQRRADALVELARLGMTANLLPTVGGVRPSLGILITPETLLDIRAQASQHLNTDALGNGADDKDQPSTGLILPGSGPTGRLFVAERARTADPPDSAEDEPPPVGHHKPHTAGTSTATRRPSQRQDALTAAGIPELPEAAWPAPSLPPSPNASPATATSGASSSTKPPDSPSKSAAPIAWSPTGCAKHYTPETAAAAGPAATPPSPGPTPTTSSPGSSAAAQTSTNSSHCADGTTSRSTKDTGASTSTPPPARSP